MPRAGTVPNRRRLPRNARTTTQASASASARWSPENRVRTGLRDLASDDPKYIAALEKVVAEAPEFSEQVANRLREILAPAAEAVSGR